MYNSCSYQQNIILQQGYTLYKENFGHFCSTYLSIEIYLFNQRKKIYFLSSWLIWGFFPWGCLWCHFSPEYIFLLAFSFRFFPKQPFLPSNFLFNILISDCFPWQMRGWLGCWPRWLPPAWTLAPASSFPTSIQQLSSRTERERGDPQLLNFAVEI